MSVNTISLKVFVILSVNIINISTNMIIKESTIIIIINKTKAINLLKVIFLGDIGGLPSLWSKRSYRNQSTDKSSKARKKGESLQLPWDSSWGWRPQILAKQSSCRNL